MKSDVKKYFLEAVGKDKNELSKKNPYRDIGFDADKRRLGWVKPPKFSEIKKSFKELLPALLGKENFIFIGMGGSINGIKPLISLFKAKSFYILDNLDPEALLKVVSQIKNFRKTLVVAISKSGTTKETQLLSHALKELFSNKLGDNKWQEHFLWLSDKIAFEKIDTLGWKGVKKATIQFNGGSDIGGRFSSPHTLIFYLPLFLLLNKNLATLGKIHTTFAKIQKEIQKKAYLISQDCKSKTDAYFSPFLDEKLNNSLSSWVVQLFQESLGSKLDNLAVKTIPSFKDRQFFSVKLDLEIKDSRTYLMAQMYFFQVFIAYYSASKKINFVTQNFVENYKKEMQKLENKNNRCQNNKVLEFNSIIEQVKKRIKNNHRFIEIVLYFYPSCSKITDNIKKEFSKNFPDKEILIFVGSDWNHQSYQAAFGSKDTFYLLLTSPQYRHDVLAVPRDIILKNIKTQLVIAQATYLTLADKAFIFALKDINKLEN